MMMQNSTDESLIEPDKFDPDRWGRDNINPFSSLPFGFGARSCWGMRLFVYIQLCLQVSIACSTILQMALYILYNVCTGRHFAVLELKLLLAKVCW